MDKKTETTEEKKAPVKKAAKTPITDKKPRVIKKKTESTSKDAAVLASTPEAVASTAKAPESRGRYIFATGRRKTSVATVRLFEGSGDSMVNKKPFATYFFNTLLQNTATRPFNVSGLGNTYYFVATINGGGMNSQAGALSHGISKALTTLGDDVHKVLKKNGLLTRDDRKKERKKPGLRRARRAPQWAKR